jgi:hypothetical protein
MPKISCEQIFQSILGGAEVFSNPGGHNQDQIVTRLHSAMRKPENPVEVLFNWLNYIWKAFSW